MATVGPYYSTEYSALYRTLPAGVGVHRNKRSHKRVEYFSYTQVATGTAADVVYLCKVPGSARILLPECFLYVSDWDTNQTLDVGWAAHTDINGDAVAADPDGLIDGLDISLGGVGVFFGMVLTVTTTNTLTIAPAATLSHQFNSKGPVDIIATFTNSVAPTQDDVIEGYITYAI